MDLRALGSVLAKLPAITAHLLLCLLLGPPGIAAGRSTTDASQARTALMRAAMASIPEAGEETLSPYFFVLSDDPITDQLPLKSTAADVWIAGTIADVRVTQVYANEGDSVLEAVYIFPASTHAAVHGMTMTIGDRVIQAQIREREQARQEYEEAREEGRTASLLEQQRPNVLQMNVANILPGDEIIVELDYTEMIVPESGLHEFVYPTVVGPRYCETPVAGASSTEQWVANPYLQEGKPSPFTFELDLTIAGGLPLASLASPSHDVGVEYEDTHTARVWLEPDGDHGTRDFVLRYCLAGKQIETGLLLYPGAAGEEGYFSLVMAPPERVKPEAVVPREYVFIVDVSGSMHGFPITVTKELMNDLFSGLRPTDHFNVMLFSSGSAVLAEASVPATADNVTRAIQFLGNQQGGGGTRILPALRQALAMPSVEGTSRTVVIATDGFVSVEAQAFEAIQQGLGEANLFAFGIGKSVNRHIIEGMAHAGYGESFVVLDPAEASARAATFREYIASPVLTDIEIDFGGLQVQDVEPPGIPDLFADRPLVVFGKYTGRPQGTLTVSGFNADGYWESSLDASSYSPTMANEALRYLWARHRIRALVDMNHLAKDDARIQQVTELGLEYNLLTAYTSFIAVDSVVRADGAPVTTVKQPLPLPDGVSNYAVGSSAASSGGSVRYYRRTEVDFDKVSVQGELHKPSGSLMLDKKRAIFAPLIQLRTNFNDEVADSVDVLIGRLPDGIPPGSDAWVARAAVLEVIEDGRAEIRDAYRTTTRAPRPRGTLQLTFTVRPDGSVGTITVVKNGTEDEDLVALLQTIVQGWAFPTSDFDVEVTVSWKFPLKR